MKIGLVSLDEVIDEDAYDKPENFKKRGRGTKRKRISGQNGYRVFGDPYIFTKYFEWVLVPLSR